MSAQRIYERLVKLEKLLQPSGPIKRGSTPWWKSKRYSIPGKEK